MTVSQQQFIFINWIIVKIDYYLKALINNSCLPVERITGQNVSFVNQAMGVARIFSGGNTFRKCWKEFRKKIVKNALF